MLLQPALAALAACTSQPAQAPAPPLPPLDLLGYRVLARAVSGATLPGFDEEAMPMLRVQGTARTSWRVQLVDATRTESVLAPATETRGQATLLRLTLAPGQRPPGEGPGELQLQDGDGAVLRRWPLLWSTPPEQHPVLAQAARLRKEGRFAEASQTLQQALSQPDAGRRYWGLVEQARLVQAERGAAAAGAAWGRGAEAAGQAGLPSEVGRCLRASAYLAYNGGRHEEALALLAQEEQARHGLDDPVGAAQASYVRGLVLQELGDYRRALEQLRRARDEAWALGLDTHWLWSMEMLADLLQLLGRHGEARQTLEQAGAFFARPGADPELRAHYLVNRGWLLLRGMAEGGEPLDPVEPLTCFEQALQLGGHDLGRRANVLVNIAWLELLRGQPAQARQRIAEARALGGEALEPVELFVALLEPELLLAEGKLEEARQGFVQAEARAREE
ncbi:MAG: tetratricopeptide repeat protein, partial [Deltaproteobacteria bacterium]|nr:tetratricopeptide repeat protein [Deltaproteobacteria bacterium]